MSSTPSTTAAPVSRGAGEAHVRYASRFDNGLRYRDESDDRQVQLTPEYVLAPVRRAFGGAIGLDPCTLPDNPTQADRFYCLPQDGAALPWSGCIFVNPPYCKARERWVERCIEAGAKGHPVVLLIPAATDTRIFQRAAASATGIAFVRGRLKFGVLRPNRRQAAASHPSAVIGWNVDMSAFSGLGLIARASEPSP